MGMPTVQFFKLLQALRHHVLGKYLHGLLRGRSRTTKCLVPGQRDWCIEMCFGVACATGTIILVLLLLLLLFLLL
jgi:hypothetical protein